VKQRSRTKQNLLLASEVAEILRVSRDRVYAMTRAGVFPIGVVVRLGRRILFSRTQLEKFLNQGGVQVRSTSGRTRGKK
jgi:excisionase family DNA binding protein